MTDAVLIAAPGAGGAIARPRARLFRKYAALFAAIVSGVLIISGAVEIYFSYTENKTALIQIQAEKADAAAATIAQFVKEIEGQLGWTTHGAFIPGQAGLEQRRFDFIRLLRQAPAITELTYVDSQGREQLRVSRLAMDVVGSQADYSADPRFAEARARRLYASPVYFRKESEPYMTLAVAGSGRRAGVTIAEVNLKFIWDLVSRIRIGKSGKAYAVDQDGRLIAHPDISLVLRKSDFSRLPHIQSALAEPAGGEATNAPLERGLVSHDRDGRDVLTATARIAPLGWLVSIDLPLNEARERLYESALRSIVLVLVGLVLAVLAGLMLARRMTVPILALADGAAQIGGGDLSRRIEVKTGDEIEALAASFNEMAARLQESYAGLERKVEARTRELTETLEYQTATSEVLSAISRSTFDLDAVLSTLTSTVARLCKAEQAIMFRLKGDEYRWAAGFGLNPAYAENERRLRLKPDRGSVVGRTALERKIVQIVDAQADPDYAYKDDARLAEIHSMIGVPLLREGAPVGVFALARTRIEPFTEKQIELVSVFADQAVIAIENARLLGELQERTNELGRTVEELKALGAVGQAVNSTLDFQRVIDTILVNACRLSDSGGGAIYAYDEYTAEFEMQASHGMRPELAAAIKALRIRLGQAVIGQCAQRREAVQVPDLMLEPSYPLREIMLASDIRALLAVPLLREDQIVGALVVRRKRAGEFTKETVALLQSFATQSVLAIQNARLFREIEEKGRQLEIASQHKSQFLANMSHELRTPMNAILGFTELIQDGIYGEPPARITEVLERVQANGRHLLGLINDVLDISKIEAGQLALTLGEYSLSDVMQSVVSATESLAAAKNLALDLDVAPDLPIGYGDGRRLAQVLLNLVGNAIKFTDKGGVTIGAGMRGGAFEITVTDTGPGIPESERERIFEEFHQVDNSNTREKGGTGLGLAIAKRIVEMHGGRIWVESVVGAGATFHCVVPMRVGEQKGAA